MIEAIAAEGAGEGPLAGVDAHVDDQVLSVAEPLRADSAHLNSEDIVLGFI